MSFKIIRFERGAKKRKNHRAEIIFIQARIRLPCVYPIDDLAFE